MRVLLVEDEDTDRTLIEGSAPFRELTTSGQCEVVCVTHPDEALRSLHNPFDLVVLDLMFPGGKGTASLYTDVPAHPLYAALSRTQTPVVAVSALLQDARWPLLLVNSLNVVALVGKGDLRQQSASVDDALRRALARATPKARRAKGPRELTWLHISDFHFGFRASGKDDRAIVEEAFLRDLQRQVKEGAAFDWIFVTGDVAFSGQPSQYEEAKIFLSKVAKVARVTTEAIHVVPGNHDLDREKITPGSRKIGSPTTKNALNQTFLESDAQLDILLSPFAGYRTFVGDFLGSAPGRTSYPELSYVWKDEARKVAIVGLNSALGSGLTLIDKEVADETRLFVGESCLRKVLAGIAPDWVTIALMHHPLEYLVEFDRADVRRMLSRHCSVLLHGHEHLNSLAKNAEGNSTMLTTLRAGSIFQGREPINSYNVATLDLDSLRIVADYRRYSDRRDEFVKDLDLTGDAGDGSLGATMSRPTGT